MSVDVAVGGGVTVSEMVAVVLRLRLGLRLSLTEKVIDLEVDGDTLLVCDWVLKLWLTALLVERD